MIRFLLGTNAISEPIGPTPDTRFLDDQGRGKRCSPAAQKVGKSLMAPSRVGSTKNGEPYPYGPTKPGLPIWIKMRTIGARR